MRFWCHSNGNKRSEGCRNSGVGMVTGVDGVVIVIEVAWEYVGREGFWGFGWWNFWS